MGKRIANARKNYAAKIECAIFTLNHILQQNAIHFLATITIVFAF